MLWGFWALINWRAKSIQHHHPPARRLLFQASQLKCWTGRARWGGFLEGGWCLTFFPTIQQKQEITSHISSILHLHSIESNLPVWEHACMHARLPQNTFGWFLSKINIKFTLVLVSWCESRNTSTFFYCHLLQNGQDCCTKLTFEFSPTSTTERMSITGWIFLRDSGHSCYGAFRSLSIIYVVCPLQTNSLWGSVQLTIGAQNHTSPETPFDCQTERNSFPGL